MTTVIATFAASGVAAVLTVTAVVAAPQRADHSSRSAMAAFDQRVAEYANLHRRLEARWPRLRTSADPNRIILHRKRLAAAIKTARPGATQGDFFDQDVAPVFRHLIDDALRGLDVAGLLDELFEEHPQTWGYTATVYESYPSWATREVPGRLLQRLPILPEEVEYRVVDHDLVIVDVEASLVLDVLPAAIARAAS